MRERGLCHLLVAPRSLARFPIPSTTSQSGLTPLGPTPMYTTIKSTGFCHRKPGHETRSSASLFGVQRFGASANKRSSATRRGSRALQRPTPLRVNKWMLCCPNSPGSPPTVAGHQPEEELFRFKRARSEDSEAGSQKPIAKIEQPASGHLITGTRASDHWPPATRHQPLAHYSCRCSVFTQ